MAVRELRFCWWNVQDFARFDANRSAFDRWPSSAAEYEEKRRRVEGAFDAMFGTDPPDVIGLCEITKAVAEELQQRRFPDHELVLGAPADSLAFQVAMLIRCGCNLSAREPIPVASGTSETRPMCVADHYTRKAHVRFIACHWTALDRESSDEMRGRCADALRDGIYEFLNPARSSTVPRHVIAFGDFNAEPQDRHFRLKLSAARDRDHARQRKHFTDAAVKRTRLYACGWRLFGEGCPHNGAAEATPRRAGTYFHAAEKEWRTYDHVLVTGGLLEDRAPFFDEAALLVRTDGGNLVGGKPTKFAFENGTGTGLSDHYPLTGRIVLG